MSKFQVLVVEDDTPVRNLITTTLKAHDYRFITSAIGEGAVMEAASHNPDIILLDLGLPDIDGVEVIRRIRSWSNVPIIVISARSEDIDKIDALDAGADDYLTKPFSVDELLARLRVVQRRLALMQNNLSQEAVYENPDSFALTMHPAVPILPIRNSLSLQWSTNYCAYWHTTPEKF